MGWTQQGYNIIGQQLGCWYVDCNGEFDKAIEKYNNRKVDIKEWSQKIKIVYGMTDREFFRGYVLSSDLNIVKSLLNKFDGFLVYGGKYGGEKRFEPQKLSIFSFLNITYFFEQNAKTFWVKKAIPLSTIIEELYQETFYGIKFGFIDNLGKSNDEIYQELKDIISL